jgi:hypothetical protein
LNQRPLRPERSALIQAELHPEKGKLYHNNMQITIHFEIPANSFFS